MAHKEKKTPAVNGFPRSWQRTASAIHNSKKSVSWPVSREKNTGNESSVKITAYVRDGIRQRTTNAITTATRRAK